MRIKTLFEIVLSLSFVFRFALNNDTPPSQCTKSNTENKVKSFNDCKSLSLSNKDNFLCCFVQPLSGSFENAFCVEMDILFTGKTIEYVFNNKNSKLTCSDKKKNTTSQNNSALFLSYKLSFNSILILFLCLVILY